MNAFDAAPLPPAGRPVLHEGEVELKLETDGVHIYSQDGKKVLSELFVGGARGRCIVVLTNVRFITVAPSADGSTRTGWGINLANVTLAEDCAHHILRRSTRMRLHVTRVTKGGKNVHIDIGIGFEREGFFGDIGLQEQRKDTFLRLVLQALSRRSWETIEQATREKELTKELIATGGKVKGDIQVRGGVAGAGVGALLNRHKESLTEAEKLTAEATHDLDGLMERARDVVKVVQRFAAFAEERDDLGAKKSSSSSSSSDGTTGEEGDDTSSIGSADTANAEMEGVLQSIGLISPVTKYSAGREYHRQLARQMVEFLSTQSRLERMGGMVTLPDLYCLYNRARGTELVSPDDLFLASKLMGMLNLGMRLVKFTSGVNMIRLDSLDDESLFRRLLSFFAGQVDKEGAASLEDTAIQSGAGLLFSDVARLMGVSIVVAKEQVLMAESKGLLCRDDTLGGVAFFANTIFV